MLFTRDTRVVLVSAPVERFLGTPRGELLGKTARDVFSDGTSFAAAFATHSSASVRCRNVNFRGRGQARSGFSGFCSRESTQSARY